MRKLFLPSLFVLLLAAALTMVRFPALAQTVNNYLYLNGNVGVGTNSPTSLFSVGSGSTTNFSVDAPGNFTANGNGTIKGNLNVTGSITSGGGGSSKPWFIASDNRGWLSSSGWTHVIYNTVRAGNSGNWYNPSTGWFTAPVAGVYYCTSTHYIYSGASGAPYIHHLIACNGSWDTCNSIPNYTIWGQNMNNYDSSTKADRIAYLNAGDTIGVNVYVSSGTYNYMYGGDSEFACSIINQ